MGKIFCIMGKSSSGKDTLYKEIAERLPRLKTVTTYTTRPIREGEENGREYYFVDEAQLKALESAGKVIELRAYDTVHGIWKYFTVDDGQVDLKTQDYLIIGTLESYEKIRTYYGKEQVVPLYVEVESGERLFRALARERIQEEPKYKELCRRFLADEEDFAEEKLRKLEINRRFENLDKDQCLKELIEVIEDGRI